MERLFVSGPEIVTLGCRLNIAESEGLRAQLAGEDDLVIVNSCAVTAEAVRDTRHAIRRAHREHPGARIIVTGCAAQIEPETFAAMPEVTRVVGNAEKQHAASFRADAALPRLHVTDIMRVRETAPQFAGALLGHSRAFVEVQNGCDHRCTFCVIPYGRGNSRSVPAALVVEHVQALVAAGYREVVLTGVDLTSYGPDLPGQPTLGRLVEAILRRVPDLPRLRLSSLDAVEIDERLFDLLTGEPRMMPHLHLSLQAGDDMILKRMKRRHSRAQAIALVERLKAKRPEIAIGADLIAGFPTEDEAMAANSLSLIDACDIVFAHIFPYSPRAGTPAARMPQVAPSAIKARAAALRAAGQRRKTAWLAEQAGRIQRVLIERGGRGHAENFARVRIAPSAAPLRQGEIAAIRPTRLEGDTLIGVPA